MTRCVVVGFPLNAKYFCHTVGGGDHHIKKQKSAATRDLG